MYDMHSCYCMCVYVCVHECHAMHVEMRRYIVEVSSLHPPCGFQGPNSDHRARVAFLENLYIFIRMRMIHSVCECVFSCVAAHGCMSMLTCLHMHIEAWGWHSVLEWWQTTSWHVCGFWGPELWSPLLSYMASSICSLSPQLQNSLSCPYFYWPSFQNNLFFSNHPNFFSIVIKHTHTQS